MTDDRDSDEQASIEHELAVRDCIEKLQAGDSAAFRKCLNDYINEVKKGRADGGGLPVPTGDGGSLPTPAGDGGSGTSCSVSVSCVNGSCTCGSGPRAGQSCAQSECTRVCANPAGCAG